MKPSTLLLAAVSLAFPLTLLGAEPSHHEHGAAHKEVELNAGKKWPTDEPLRKGMGTIRERVSGALPQAHAGKLSAAQYEQLAQDLDNQVSYIVQNCKLDPKADAQLHVIIGDLVQGIRTIEGRQPDKERALGVVKVAHAVNTYGKTFDHAGWKPVRMPH